ncbi:Bacteriophage tail sheath protein [Alloalcanivorax xenomutans]|uniref:phage tail sheath subtilisin-like domain-containing protein n=1 Tax=Alloalcanivorax xenomutans TaxID=1094342 RepID=UPI0006D5C383|nr:phage tail sheath subtilisin-like domain-containing protein [Alloalcanivorax xenomutans]CUR45506.1 Bacteriophage tail sheath protein [Alloalcanivorax xenomutans]
MSFNEIPSNVRQPLVYIEFDNSNAVQGTPQISHKVLLIGQRLASGQTAAGVARRITSPAQAEAAFGRGSMLAAMCAAKLNAERYLETWAIALDDDGAAAKATGKITVTGTASQAGTVNLYLAGQRVRVGVQAADTAEDIAASVEAAINEDDTLPVAAAVNGTNANEVDLTCRWAGETGNDIDLRANYYQGEETPAGVAITFTDMSGGTANPDVGVAVAAMGDEWWNTIVMPYTDTANLDALNADLLERWGPMRMIDGIAYAAFRGTYGETATWGSARNDHLVTVMGTGASPTPPWIWAANNAAVAADSLSRDPARPLQTLELNGVLPPVVEARFANAERNLLLFDGISTYTVNAAGRVQIERQITTYQENAYGVADPSYLDVTTPATLGYIRFATRARITQRFPRHKLADDGTNVAPGQPVVTPSAIRDQLLALFRELESDALVENFEHYKEDLVVQRNADDRNRVDVFSHPDLINQFRIYAEQIGFIL